MNLYIVTKEGVYRHDMLGIFDTVEQANKHCDKCFTIENDDYHDFHVYELELNKEYTEDPDKLISTAKPPRTMIEIPFEPIERSN